MRGSLRLPARLMLVAACWAAMSGWGCGDEEEIAPNLLLVTVDSLRADFLGCYGGREDVGVRMCSLADEGARYTWAFAPASSSPASVASLLTSRYPSAHSVGASAASFLPEEHVTLAEELRRTGYATAAFVGSPELNRSRNLVQGFDLYDDRTRRTSPSGLPWRRASDLTTSAMRWMRAAKPPWFVWIHYREPHGPYDSPVPVGAEGATGAGDRLRVLPTATGRGGIPGYQALPGLFTRQAYEARYRAEIRTVDEQLATLLAEIEARHRPFAVALTADHGEAFGEDRYYLSHGHSIGLDQIRVPLFWRPPGGGRPEQIDVPVSTLDVMPSLLRTAGIVAAERLEGWRLPSADDPPGPAEHARAIFAEHPLQVAVASGESFYQRLREPVVPAENGTPEAPSASYLRAAAARTAHLGRASAGLPEYQPARPSGIAPLLEPLVTDFLSGPHE